MQLLDVDQVAQILGVSRSRVSQKLATGQLAGTKVAGRWVVDKAILPNERSRRGAGRPIAASSAWNVLRMANEAKWAARPGDGLSAVSRSRARSRLAELAKEVGERDPAAVNAHLRRLLGNRAARRTFRASVADCEDLAQDARVALSGVSAQSSNISAGGTVEAYVDEGHFQQIIDEYLLDDAPANEANVVLHVVPPEAPRDWRDLTGSRVLLAADLAEHSGTRENLQAFRLMAQTVAGLSPHDARNLEDPAHG